MIKRFIRKILHKKAPATTLAMGKRQVHHAAAHKINPELVNERALQVVDTLKKAGYEAYIVGGAVRDLLLNLRPKDFDVATNATPEEVKRLFRRAFIIGRRFRIVHVVYGRGRSHETIEVSTFRAHVEAKQSDTVSGNEKTSRQALAGMRHAVDTSGRVLRDNVWGSQQEDAARRDFTINAMYYDPQENIVVDYHGGIQDANKKMLRMIGDATTRYREDPVRIIRAVRFSAKLTALGFKLEAKTKQAIAPCLDLLADIPQSRLFDETLKLLQTGHALASVTQLKTLGLLTGIYPLLDIAVERADTPFVQTALQDTDNRVAESKPVAPSFLVACLLWQDVCQQRDAFQAQGESPFVAQQAAIDAIFNAHLGEISGRGKLAADMREIWMMQLRFEKRTGRSPYSLIAQLRYRAGFDFLYLRATVGQADEALATWWQTFSTADDAVREDLIAQVRAQQAQQRQNKTANNAKKPRPRRRKKPVADQTPQAPSNHAETSQKKTSSKPARRKRKPKPAADAAQ